MARKLSNTKVDKTEAEARMTEDKKFKGVTPENMGSRHRMYAMVHYDPGVMGININPLDHSSQWGAWRAYFKAKGMPLGFMDQQGQRLAMMSKEARKTICGYLVPCDFPADFDGEWPAENDRYASDKFVAAQAKKREEVKAMEGIDKAAVIKAAMAKRVRV